MCGVSRFSEKVQAGPDREPRLRHQSINICLSVYLNLVLVLVFVDALESHLFIVVRVFVVVV